MPEADTCPVSGPKICHCATSSEAAGTAALNPKTPKPETPKPPKPQPLNPKKP